MGCPEEFIMYVDAGNLGWFVLAALVSLVVWFLVVFMTL